MTETVYVVVTEPNETRAAVLIASELSQALRVRLTIVEFQTTTTNATLGASPAPAKELADWLRGLGLDASVRIYVCSDPREAFHFVFRPQSLVVVGGTRGWWPTRAARMRNALEAAGHRVLFVDEVTHAA